MVAVLLRKNREALFIRRDIGRIMAAHPYIGNIMGEVLALRLKSRFLRERREVKVTSINNPVSPHKVKFLRNP